MAAEYSLSDVRCGLSTITDIVWSCLCREFSWTAIVVVLRSICIVSLLLSCVRRVYVLCAVHCV